VLASHSFKVNKLKEHGSLADCNVIFLIEAEFTRKTGLESSRSYQK
jgi:hypothetical protein